MRWWYLLGIIPIFYIWKWRRIHSEIKMIIHNGVEPVEPQVLASDRGVNVDVYSLARAMQSEDPWHYAARIGIGWCVKNHANNLKISITTLVTRNKNPNHADHNGFYGREVPGQYCATTLDPDNSTIIDAQSIIDGSIDDPTGGATLWDGPSGQDAAHTRNPEQVPNDWAAQKAQRESEGYTLVELPGVTSTVFWRR